MADEREKKNKKYSSKYLESFHQEWPCIRKSTKGECHAFCTLCSADFSVKAGGKHDVFRHVSKKKHQDFANARSSEMKDIGSYFVKKDDDAVIKAECLFTSCLVEHNIQISASDHASTVFKKMFPDSQIAAKYGCGRTKTSAIINVMALWIFVNF